jgi:hypothetical protein
MAGSSQTTVWDDPAFAQAWNDTYGLAMERAPVRGGLIYPLLKSRINWDPTLRLADFGCGNGNLMRALQPMAFSRWFGFDSGSAILDTARPLQEADPRFVFDRVDIAGKMKGYPRLAQADHAISVFTLEEIPVSSMPTLFNNLAETVRERRGHVHIFTQHPAYALQQDLLAGERNTPNAKFAGHDGYFDTTPTTYNLSVLNQQNGVAARAEYHHKPLGLTLNGLMQSGLELREMIEVPAGVTKLEQLQVHQPKSGDVPRFLYLRLQAG